MSGISVDDAVANAGVFRTAIAASASVSESSVTVTISDGGRRRLDESGAVAVAYEITADTTSDLVAVMDALDTDDFQPLIAAAAADAGVSETFADVVVTDVADVVLADAAAEDEEADAAPMRRTLGVAALAAAVAMAL